MKRENREEHHVTPSSMNSLYTWCGLGFAKTPNSRKTPDLPLDLHEHHPTLRVIIQMWYPCEPLGSRHHPCNPVWATWKYTATAIHWWKRGVVIISASVPWGGRRLMRCEEILLGLLSLSHRFSQEFHEISRVTVEWETVVIPLSLSCGYYYQPFQMPEVIYQEIYRGM